MVKPAASWAPVSVSTFPSEPVGNWSVKPLRLKLLPGGLLVLREAKAEADASTMAPINAVLEKRLMFVSWFLMSIPFLFEEAVFADCVERIRREGDKVRNV